NRKPCVSEFIIINLSQKGRDDVGYKLQQVRESAGMTQDQLAAKSGVSRNWIWKIETGKTDNVSIKVLLALANALGVKIDDIFFLDE
ncbi:helix-turn-helix transcriptional regulator, partial [Faecalibaculum rodentium]|uniref:helix-turn-helix transcriptional regulator n=2 Tax=Faecalibaculum rodentium TaxID=1702221 RepID=UPI0025A4D95C